MKELCRLLGGWILLLTDHVTHFEVAVWWQIVDSAPMAVLIWVKWLAAKLSVRWVLVKGIYFDDRVL